MSQYNQPIYVSSNSSQSLSQQQMNSAPIQNQNGPIYVSSNVANQPGMMMAAYPAVNNTHNIAPEQGKFDRNLNGKNQSFVFLHLMKMCFSNFFNSDIYGQTNGSANNSSINNGYGSSSQATSQYGQPVPPVAPPPPPFAAG